MKMKLDDFAFEPVRVHATDAGLDLRAAHIKFVSVAELETLLAMYGDKLKVFG